MTSANHVLVGSSIAVIVHEPLLALPLAFTSHFILDSFPHFGYNRANYAELFRHKLSFLTLAFDLSGLFLAMYLFNIFNPEIFACSVMAVLPDAEWLKRYFLYERKGKKYKGSIFYNFHYLMNWGEKPFGLIIEVLFYVIILLAVSHFYVLHHISF